MNKRLIIRIETGTGYPVVVYTLARDKRRRFKAMYFRTRFHDRGPLDRFYTSDGMHGYSGNVLETDPEFIQALRKLEYVPGRDCLASAPWLTGN